MNEIDVNHVLQMGQEYETTKQATIKQLLDRQKETAEQLKVLGYEGKQPKPGRTRKPCSKCSSTEHDARFHRGEKRKNSRGEGSDE